MDKQTTHNTRFASNENIRLPRPEKTIGKRGYGYIGLKFYDYLPLELKQKSGYKSFGKLVNTFLLENELYLF